MSDPQAVLEAPLALGVDDHSQLRTSDRVPIMPPDPTSVYRYYDRNDLLLYVGITRRGIARNVEHNTSKDWWPFVVRQEVEHFPHRLAATQREKHLIRKYTPPFNKQHNPSHADLSALYLASGLGERRGKRAGGNVTVTSAPARRMFAEIKGEVPLTLLETNRRKAVYVSKSDHYPLVRETHIRGQLFLRNPKRMAELVDRSLIDSQCHYTFLADSPSVKMPRAITLRVKATQRPFSLYGFEAVAA